MHLTLFYICKKGLDLFFLCVLARVTRLPSSARLLSKLFAFFVTFRSCSNAPCKSFRSLGSLGVMILISQVAMQR
jgi:hypothetical protein